MSEACCGMAAEGHGCNCPTMKAETATVQEPDWIPDGDGRAIGQQDFAINLSPLHAEHEQGYNDRDDESIGERHRGRHSQSMKSRRDESKGMTDSLNPHHPYSDVSTMSADVVGSPSPTFNEDITGQDGPSANPTNASFAAFEGYRDRYDPVKYGHADVKRFRSKLNSMGLSNIVYDIFLYNDEPSKKTGRPANKAYYVAIVEKNGNYYPIAGYGGMNKPSGFRFTNIYGGQDGDMASVSDMMQAWSIAQEQISKKKKRKYRELPYRMNAESKGAETLAQIEGPTAEATSGGLHSPSSFTIGWEDGTGYSSASMPPNEIAWAENVKGGEGMGKNLLTYGAIGVLLYGAYSIFKGNKVFNAVNSRNHDCGCGSKVQRTETVKKHSEYSLNQINPVEVEGQNDIHNAESIRLPQPHAGPQSSHLQNPRRSLKMW